jgi:hypothetical protein
MSYEIKEERGEFTLYVNGTLRSVHETILEAVDALEQIKMKEETHDDNGH